MFRLIYLVFLLFCINDNVYLGNLSFYIEEIGVLKKWCFYEMKLCIFFMFFDIIKDLFMLMVTELMRYKG